jgi:predicted O-methyltransferase YrrM
MRSSAIEIIANIVLLNPPVYSASKYNASTQPCAHSTFIPLAKKDFGLAWGTSDQIGANAYIMNSAYTRSKFVQFAYATAKCLAMANSPGKGRADFLRQWLKFPLTYQASKALEGVPVTTISELFAAENVWPVFVPAKSLDRHPWNIRLDEEILIGLIVQSLAARRIFEIGTFDGGTTRLLADKAGEGAQVFTLDLPEAEFDLQLRHWERNPSWLHLALALKRPELGMKFRGAAMESRIKQLLGNSLEFDFSPYERSIDLVFVDAAHDYPHGFADTRTALRLLRPGGVVLWHDFDPGFPGLVQAIIEATAGLPLKRLGIYTRLGFLRTAS